MDRVSRAALILLTLYTLISLNSSKTLPDSAPTPSTWTTKCTNTTQSSNTNSSSSLAGDWDEDPPNYPHQIILKLLKNYTFVPGLFETEGPRQDLRVKDVVHNNNFDFENEMFK